MENPSHFKSMVFPAKKTYINWSGIAQPFSPSHISIISPTRNPLHHPFLMFKSVKSPTGYPNFQWFWSHDSPHEKNPIGCHTPIIIPYEMIPALDITTRKLCAPSKSAGTAAPTWDRTSLGILHKRYQVDGHGKFSIYVENSGRSGKINENPLENDGGGHQLMISGQWSMMLLG